MWCLSIFLLFIQKFVQIWDWKNERDFKKFDRFYEINLRQLSFFLDCEPPVHGGGALVCEPNVVQLSGTPAISKYQNVNESLNSNFDLAN